MSEPDTYSMLSGYRKRIHELAVGDNQLIDPVIQNPALEDFVVWEDGESTRSIAQKLYEIAGLCSAMADLLEKESIKLEYNEQQ